MRTKNLKRRQKPTAKLILGNELMKTIRQQKKEKEMVNRMEQGIFDNVEFFLHLFSVLFPVKKWKLKRYCLILLSVVTKMETKTENSV